MSSLWEKIEAKVQSVTGEEKFSRELTDDGKKKIFMERAEALAQIEDRTDREKDLLHFISFQIGDESYGVEVKHLVELYEVQSVTSIPCTPPFIAGLVNFRGTVVTVVDLKSLFSLQGGGEREEKGGGRDEENLRKILIMEEEGVKMGLEADSFGTLVEVSQDEVRPVSSVFYEKNPIVSAEALIDGRPFMIIDVKLLKNDDRLKVNEEV